MTPARVEDRTVVRIFGVVEPMFAARGLAAPRGTAADLRAEGLTSLDMVNLMLAVEAEFDIFIPQELIRPENFRSIAAIERLVASLAGSS